MGISKFNSEGYHDPTAYEALTHIAQEKKIIRYDAFKPLVYICSPFAGEIKRNEENARKYCRFALEHNAMPVAMHLLLPQFMDDDDPAERELAMFINYVMLGKCDELWVFGSTISNGMAREITIARKRRQTIRYFNEDLEEVTE